MKLTSDLIADYALELSADRLTDEAIDAAKRHTLDTLGCCLGAYTSPPSKHLRSVYGSLGGSVAATGTGPGDATAPENRPGGNTATVFGSGEEALLEYAALINSTMARYLDYNDTYISEGRACHPSDHIPALISVAQAERATGEELVEAIVLAYEIEGMGLDTGAAWPNDYDYVTWGAYSSVAAVGKLMGLSRDALVSALGIAGASSLTLSISRRGEVSMWKGVAHPYVTHNAIQACQLARAGLTGPEAVFEGPGGFFEVVADRELTVDALGGRNGAPYRITKSHIKPFPCGYYMQPMITGVRDLVVENDLSPADVEAIEIETFEEAVTVLGGDEKWSKELTRESADHSIPYTASLAVAYGDVTPAHYAEEHRSDPEIHRLMDLVSVSESEEMNAAAVANPESTPSHIRLSANGETYETRVDYAPGHAKNPLPTTEVESKTREMAEPLLTDDQIETMIEHCRDLPARPTVDALVDALEI